MIYKKHYTAI